MLALLFVKDWRWDKGRSDMAAVALLLPIPGSTLVAIVFAFVGLFRPIRRWLVLRREPGPAQVSN
ncbi:MAG: hypothetical protein V3W37_00300 [Candidatus Binatia bacterium]